MELGGNAPFIVLDDADLVAAVEGAIVAKRRNGGASCIAANRLFVQSAVADRFTEAFARRMGEFTLGHGVAEETRVGSLVTEDERQRLSSSSTTQSPVAPVSRRGCCTRPRRLVLPRHRLSGVAADADVLDAELFGPVAPVVPFDTDDEPIAMANATHVGLAAYVYSSNLARAMRVTEAVETGMVGVNRGFLSDPAAPFGGVKRSGLGREGGHEGVEEFLETKYVAVDWNQARAWSAGLRGGRAGACSLEGLGLLRPRPKPAARRRHDVHWLKPYGRLIVLLAQPLDLLALKAPP